MPVGDGLVRVVVAQMGGTQAGRVIEERVLRPAGADRHGVCDRHTACQSRALCLRGRQGL